MMGGNGGRLGTGTAWNGRCNAGECCLGKQRTVCNSFVVSLKGRSRVVGPYCSDDCVLDVPLSGAWPLFLLLLPLMKLLVCKAPDNECISSS